MVSKNQIKYIRALQQKKFRQKYNKYAVEGPKIASEALKSKPELIREVYALSNWISDHRYLLEQNQLPVTEVSPMALSQLSVHKSPNQVLLVMEMAAEQSPIELAPGEWGLYLDGLQDPGNVGTIIRIADWFGWTKVVLGPGCADLFNPKTLQSTMGSFLRVDCPSFSWETLKSSGPSSLWYGAVLQGKPLNAEQSLEPGWLVIGNESQGIQGSLLNALDHQLSIPRGGPDSGAESLNAAVATGIFCSWLTR